MHARIKTKIFYMFYLERYINAKVIYRVIDNKQSFPLTGCGKRNNLKLKEMGFSNSLKILGNNFIMSGNEYVRSYYDYLHTKDCNFVIQLRNNFNDDLNKDKVKVKSRFKKGQK